MQTRSETFLANELAKIRSIVLGRLRSYPTAKVYLFGSRAAGADRPMSDVDVAIESGGCVPRVVLSEIRAELDESAVVLAVDIVNLDEADADFHERVVRTGVLWTDSESASTSRAAPSTR